MFCENFKNFPTLNTKFFRFITLFLLFWVGTHATNMRCEFNLFQSWMLPERRLYSCHLRGDILSRQEKPINDIKGSHQEGKNNDVEFFGSSGNILRYFPAHVEDFFPNLIVVDIFEAQMEEVLAKDLKPFPKLRVISFMKSKLAYLEPDLFQFNPNLEFIHLDGNKLKHVSYGAFANLPKLHTLHLNSNPCISEQALNDTASVVRLIGTAEEKCVDENIALTILFRSQKESASDCCCIF